MPCINCEYGNKHCDDHGEYTKVECLFPDNVAESARKDAKVGNGPMHDMYYTCPKFEPQRCFGEWG